MRVLLSIVAVIFAALVLVTFFGPVEGKPVALINAALFCAFLAAVMFGVRALVSRHS